jgi:acyl-CoA thioester hydrolase
MGVVWHGNYMKFFEDAREHFGELFKLEYLEIHKIGFFVPITETSIKHLGPIYYGDKIEISIKFICNKAAKIKFEYVLKNIGTQKIVAKGTTTQVFVDAETRDLVLYKPPFFHEWESKQNWIDVS